MSHTVPDQSALLPARLRVLVTGGRDFARESMIRKVFTELDREHPDTEIVLVHGDCPTGADAIAKAVAVDLEWATEAHPADWAKHGRAAGPIRNQQMIDLGADVCLAFPSPSSKGTWHCANAAKAAGIPTKIYQL